MSNHLRDDNECQNCGYTVDRAYCSNCGQKNTETRQPFHHLFTHFVEDLTHYDGAFWKTIKHLLFRPGRLTKEYLIGKRQTYVPPVKLYIFISFVTFFFMSITSTSILETKVVEYNVDYSANGQPVVSTTDEREINIMGFSSLKQLDSIQKFGAEHEKLNSLEYKLAKGIFTFSDKGYTLIDFFKELVKITPKVLFFYLPVFAFWLWVFHGKKRWYFFDHGIFTLHYFSFLLLLFFIKMVVALLCIGIFGKTSGQGISNVFNIVTTLYAFFYFFRSHRRMYGEGRLVSRLKSSALFIINMIFFVLAVTIAVLYIFINIH